MVCFIHDCVLKGLAHDSQIIHELPPIFKHKLQGCLKASSPSTSLGYLGGKTVPFGVQSLHLLESCPAAIVLFPNPTSGGAGPARRQTQTRLSATHCASGSEPSRPEPEQNPAVLTYCGAVTRPPAAGF